MSEWTTLKVERHGEHVAEVILNRPDKGNAMNPAMFREIAEVFDALDADDAVRAIVLRGEGRAFSYGLDLQEAMGMLGPHLQGGLGGQRKRLYALIKELQHQTGSPARCRKPVVAAVHGWCIGGGVDLISACDVRLCEVGAKFSVREARIGIVADIGSLQRLPRIIGDAATRELALTAKDIGAERALRMGLVSDVVEGAEALRARALAEAEAIAGLSPLVVQGVKQVLDATSGKSIDDGLEYVALWNSAFLASLDLGEAMASFFEKREPRYTGE
ncbi:MAG: enoyl-CoA hydratase [Myxococcales bacterium]|nr:enoyl-CoA hydratase [Myxococcales bacterium]